MSASDCDIETGVCTPASLESGARPGVPTQAGIEVVYVGDPMCSWCWGIAPNLQRLAEHCRDSGLAFRVVVGGLRPGGGDAWTGQFKRFLEHHWREIGKLTGQPFGYELLERDAFDYDTEPACRAVVAARPQAGAAELDFFYAVQRKFYVDNEDPKDVDFYRDICAALELDFDRFRERFESDEVRAETLAEFQLNRSWGVTGYPTVLVRTTDRRTTLATGYATFEDMRDRLERVRPAA